MAMPTMPSVITYSQPSPGRKMKNPLPRWLIAHATAITPTMPAAANGVSSPSEQQDPAADLGDARQPGLQLGWLHPHRPEPPRRAVDVRPDVVDAVRQHHGTGAAAQQQEREVDRVERRPSAQSVSCTVPPEDLAAGTFVEPPEDLGPRRIRRHGHRASVRFGTRRGRYRDATCVDGTTVAEVLAAAERRYGQRFSDVLTTCRIWVNGDTAHPDTTVGPHDEVAVLPPVSGG